MVTALTSRAGSRKVTGLTIAPSRMRRVSALRWPRVVYASSISWVGGTRLALQQVVGHPQCVQATLVGLPGDPAQPVGQPGRPAGPGEVGDGEADAHRTSSLSLHSSMPSTTSAYRRSVAATGERQRVRDEVVQLVHRIRGRAAARAERSPGSCAGPSRSTARACSPWTRRRSCPPATSSRTPSPRARPSASRRSSCANRTSTSSRTWPADGCPRPGWPRPRRVSSTGAPATASCGGRAASTTSCGWSSRRDRHVGRAHAAA